MAYKYLKYAGLAALLLGCSAGLAQAGPAPTPDELRAMINSGTKSTVGIDGKTITTGGNARAGSTAIVSGFNLEHCATSVWFTPDNVSFFIFAFNNDGSVFFAGINTPLITSVQEELIDVCRAGQLYGVFVTNTSTGAFDEIVDKF
ncbi:MAG: hypothetical protein M3Z96_02800 [Pseudomonadota bacterium]|nr:hypothetical protein [Pseudomonadota bacterium]